MNRTHFLTLAAAVAFLIGALAYLFPAILLADMKEVVPTALANTMARTVGIVLIGFAVLNYSVRNHKESKTLRAVFVANIVVQVGILPIDPLAWYVGTYSSTVSFVPNTILHVLLIIGFLRFMPSCSSPDRAGAVA